MRKVLFTGWMVFFSMVCLPLWGLDPVAPKSERAFGLIEVKSPLPEDRCEVVAKNGNFTQTFKSGETIRVPIGDYMVKVALQDAQWSQEVKVTPTERTFVTVTGYGNLKVSTPSTGDLIEVWNANGQKVKDLIPSKIYTLPTGNYTVKVKVGKGEAVQENVVIITNTTREISVTLG